MGGGQYFGRREIGLPSYNDLSTVEFYPQFSACFGFVSFNFGLTKTPKLAVSLQKRNNRNKCFVSDSAETSFGSSFGCFESKLVSKDTLTVHNLDFAAEM